MVKSTKLLCKSPRGRGRGRGRVIRICCSLAVLTSCGHVHDGLKHHVVLAFLPSTLLSLQSGVWKSKAPGGLQGCASVEVGGSDPGLLFPPASVSLVLSPSLLLCLISPVPHKSVETPCGHMEGLNGLSEILSLDQDPSCNHLRKGVGMESDTCRVQGLQQGHLGYVSLSHAG